MNRRDLREGLIHPCLRGRGMEACSWFGVVSGCVSERCVNEGKGEVVGSV